MADSPPDGEENERHDESQCGFQEVHIRTQGLKAIKAYLEKPDRVVGYREDGKPFDRLLDMHLGARAFFDGSEQRGVLILQLNLNGRPEQVSGKADPFA